eukprot:TRINITY_DN12096_c0_g1_i3.p1 TRINITY_DN12096_c0_g1~~TRINITY_DN12096_c0_g1_i3.p1  ORF type:complete len:251 (+),score=-16.11 TRINITY_DN12096_c0_g1_i3:1202-1954(+)
MLNYHIKYSYQKFKNYIVVYTFEFFNYIVRLQFVVLYQVILQITIQFVQQYKQSMNNVKGETWQKSTKLNNKSRKRNYKIASGFNGFFDYKNTRNRQQNSTSKKIRKQCMNNNYYNNCTNYNNNNNNTTMNNVRGKGTPSSHPSYILEKIKKKDINDNFLTSGGQEKQKKFSISTTLKMQMHYRILNKFIIILCKQILNLYYYVICAYYILYIHIPLYGSNVYTTCCTYTYHFNVICAYYILYIHKPLFM